MVKISDLNRSACSPTQVLSDATSVGPTIEQIEVTPEFEKALELIEARTTVVFVTGCAGTGKTTFIDFLRKRLRNNISVVAPTGVAAIRVRGQTIHSFFRFPARPIDLDSITLVRNRTLYERLEILIIDEVSMVRADLLDAVDRFLRINTGDHNRPFGGVQIILVGDLFQLPPVVSTSEEARLFSSRYLSPYFFSAHCLQECSVEIVELTKVFRQSDMEFIGLLNSIRVQEGHVEAIEHINNCCLRKGASGELAVHLTPTNAMAARINEQRLASLAGGIEMFQGAIQGQFNIEKEKLPAPFKLELKHGAQVMFTKNDPGKRWVNGTTGIVTGWTLDSIQVETRSAEKVALVEVSRVSWESYSYRYDEFKDKVVAEVIGKYTQFPLTLAWAVTIHKAQGVTLDHAFIDLGQGAFAHGQVYVALSRCRTLEGIRLGRAIYPEDVICNETVKRFYKGIN